ncbi:hypothetical protein [Hydrogenophaga sp.]|uniref:hypothetical protein n=1 Tax=Hydrogenophaga sp. TaxID=1904254 RepID=UPI0027320F6D|nr:hypothetical protein [Hydrogenophaga sp.]MDP2073685.1 hypothetical protein [Hydrogenophaga sp.]MDP3107244.1 hypothetical protein [Hydrogenophaga sp.]
MASKPLHNKRWWLWWPLLAILAWLVVQEQSSPGVTSDTSPPAPAQPGRLRTAPPGQTLQTGVGTAPLALVPRGQLLRGTGTNPLPTTRDLFAALGATPPTSAPVVAVVEAPSAPVLPFRYVGKQWDGKTWEVYAVTGDQTYVLREGQILDDQYRVDRIAPPHATITYLPLGTVQNLSIGDTR